MGNISEEVYLFFLFCSRVLGMFVPMFVLFSAGFFGAMGVAYLVRRIYKRLGGAR